MNNDFIEQRIIGAVRGLLTGRVNEIVSESQYAVPVIEFGDYCGASVIVPVITLAACECSEKERIIRLDAYSLTVSISLPDTPEGELYCYAYSGAVGRAFWENPTIGGIADRAVVTGKKYLPPKKLNYGEGWELIITLRVTVEGNNYAG